MAGKEAAEGSQARRRMDLNLYVGLPPLSRPQVWLDTSAATPTLMPNSTGAEPEAPRTGEPEESLAPVATANSPSNALSAHEEHQMLDPIVYSWLDGNSASGDEYTALLAPTQVERPNVSGPQLLEGQDLLVARFMRPSRVAAATSGMQMVNTSTLGPSTQGAASAGTTLESGAPELRLLRAIQISRQHSIVRPGSANRNQEAASADADSLALAIEQTHSSLEAARGQNQNGGDNSSFECSICLELARQPVVTSCGHLFCWPCLYQWIHAQDFFECPVCKGEVLKGDITPMYGRGGEEEGASTANPGLPPRPQARRRESLRQQLQMAQAAGRRIEMARLLRQMIHNQIQGWDVASLQTPAAVETTSVPAARRRAGARRQQRQNNSASRSIPSGVLNVGNVGPQSSNQNQLPHSNGDNAAPVVLAAPQQPSSVEQLPTPAAPIVDEPGPSRRSRRPSESPTIRRTRGRPQ